MQQLVLSQYFWRLCQQAFPQISQRCLPNTTLKDACKIDEVPNIEHWKMFENHFEANSFVNERKGRVNTGCVPKPYEDSANEDFVLLKELPFSEENVENVV
jgi:hypothetical protein